MPTDFYDSEPSGQSPAPSNADHDAGAKPESEGVVTALVPTNICPDQMKAGDELHLRVKRVLDDQYEVYYEPKDEEGSEEEPAQEQPATPMMAGGGNPGGDMYE